MDRWKITVYAVDGLFVGPRRHPHRLPHDLGPAVGLGMGDQLDAIAAAVIGGTSLSGGEGSIVGTIIGAFLISTLRSACRSPACRTSGSW